MEGTRVFFVPHETFWLWCGTEQRVYAEWEKLVCPLFDLPGVSNQLMFPDWMHVMDEGFGALVAGQILHYLLPFYPGNSAARRVEKLWEHIQCLYQADKTEACRRLTKLTLKDIVKPKKPAELDVKVAQCRYFMPLLPKLTEAKLGHVKMYFPHKTVIFHCHVSLQEGNSLHVKNRLS